MAKNMIKKILLIFLFISSAPAVNAVEITNSLKSSDSLKFVVNPTTEKLSDQTDNKKKITLNIIENKDNILLNFTIAKGHFLYKNKIKVTSIPDNINISNKIQFPGHIVFTDKMLNEKFNVYANTLNLSIKKSLLNKGLKVEFQGCREDGFCFAPVVKTHNLLNKNLNTKHSNSTNNKNIKKATNITPKEGFYFINNNIEYVIKALNNDSLAKLAIIFLIFGIILSLTPCVLPMIPIILSIIVGRTDLTSKIKTVLLASTYVTSMALTYAGIGIITGILGYNLQITLQNPAAIIITSIIIILFAFNMMGLYKIKLPFNVNKLIYNVEKKQAHGSFINASILGILAALVITPCVTPALAGAITYLAKEGSPIKGGIALFFMGFGIGVPLILFAIGGSVMLPKTGKWMELLKKITGLFLLALAVWILSRILTTNSITTIWGVYFVIIALFFVCILKNISGIASLLSKLAIITIFLFGIVLISAGVSNFVIFSKFVPTWLSKKRLENKDNKQGEQLSLRWSYVGNIIDFDKSIKQASSQGKGTIVFVYANWCTTCHTIKKQVFTDNDVITSLTDKNLIMIDLTTQNKEKNRLIQELRVFGVPTTIIYSKTKETHRFLGNISKRNFMDKLI